MDNIMCEVLIILKEELYNINQAGLFLQNENFLLKFFV